MATNSGNTRFTLDDAISATPAPATSPIVPPVLREDPREAAARILLAAMPRDLAALVTEMSYQHLRLPLWATLVGACYTLNEWGHLITISLPPTTRREVDGYSTPMDAAGPSTCEGCHIAFRPRWYRQRFHSNECGQAFMDAAAAKARAVAPALTHG